MTRATRTKKVNAALAALPTYHRAIPLDEIFSLLRANDFQPVQEDGTPWEGLLCGREGRLLVRLDEAGLPVNPAKYLAMTWYRMDVTGNYEIVAYVS